MSIAPWNNPNVQRGLLDFGLGTLSATQPGVNMAQAVGQGGLHAMDQFDQRRQQQAARELQERGLDLRERGVELQEGQFDWQREQAEREALMQQQAAMEEAQRRQQLQGLIFGGGAQPQPQQQIPGLIDTPGAGRLGRIPGVDPLTGEIPAQGEMHPRTQQQAQGLLAPTAQAPAEAGAPEGGLLSRYLEHDDPAVRRQARAESFRLMDAEDFGAVGDSLERIYGARDEAGPGTQTERLVESLSARPGIDRQRAEDIAHGLVDFQMTEAGFVRGINRITGEAWEVPVRGNEDLVEGRVGERADPRTAETQPRPETETDRTRERDGPKLWDLAEHGTGPISATVAGWQRVFGNVPGLGEMGDETMQARTLLRSSGADIVRSMSVNPRFPVGEMEWIRSQFDLEPGVLDSPVAMRSRMAGLHKHLERRMEEAEQDAADTTLDTSTRSAQRANAQAIRNFLPRLGVPDEVLGDYRALEPPAEVQFERMDDNEILEHFDSERIQDMSESEWRAFERELERRGL